MKCKRIISFLLAVCIMITLSPQIVLYTKAATKFYWPLPTNYPITTGYYYSNGKCQYGVDMAANQGTPVYAIFSGTAVYYQVYTTISGTNYLTSYGNCVYLTSNDGTYFAQYAHLNAFEGFGLQIPSSQTSAKSGSTGKITIGTRTVKEGDVLGYVGTTGNSTGPHLHFGLKINGSYVDPTGYLDRSKSANDGTLVDFPGEEDTSWNVPVWKTANSKLNTYDSYGNQEANRWIDQGDNCYIEKVYKNGYAWVKYPSGSSERWAYTNADGFSLEKKNVINDSIVDLGDSFSARIRHGDSGKLLTDINDNVALYEHQNDNIANQIWKFQRNSNGSYKIISSVSDVAMDLDGASDSDGTNIKMYENYSTIAQNWFVHQSSDGLYYFRSECSQNRVFDLCNGATDNNTNLQLWTYNGTDAQKFRVDKCAEILDLGDEFKGFIMSTDCWKPIMQTDDNNVVLGTENAENMKRSLWHFYRNKETGYYTIYNYLNGKCLDVHNASDEDGANVQCFDQHDTSAQRWLILKSSDGSYTYIKAGCSSNNLDVENGSTEDGANIQIYSLNGTAAQKFTIYKLDETRDKISYDLIANKSDINVGDSVSIEITNAIYAIDYKLYIVNPDGSKDSISLDMNHKYTFSPTKAGKYTIYAGVTSPVSSYTGSEKEDFIEINVNKKIISGDVNSDEAVNMKDIVLLQQYLNNWGVEINTDASDVNNDGVINMKDIVLLQQYLNGWNVDLL